MSAQPDFAHYRMVAGEIEMEPAATSGNCLPYLIERDGQDVLCIMEGGAYHQFDISPRGLQALAEDAAKQLRKHLR